MAFAFGELRLLPDEFAKMTYRDYVNFCVGYFNKAKRDERIERQAQWLAYMAVVDPKHKPSSIEKWWPIDGDKDITFKMPSKKRLLQIDKWVKNLGKNKNG